MKSESVVGGSFRDPSGFVFFENGRFFRQVNECYKSHYDELIDSGLYESLASEGLIVSHKEVSLDIAKSDEAYKVLEVESIPYVSYPYEWSFSQLSDAALLTLQIQRKAFDLGMTLKDGTAYNVVFSGCRPVFIDTLSFEKYEPGQPWFAYKQFCQHFLAPLLLMAYRDVRLSELLRVHIDGIPLDMVSRLLPRRTWLSFSVLSHIHLNAKSQKYFKDSTTDLSKKYKVSRLGFLGIIESLRKAVEKLKWSASGTEWGDYYEATNYSDKAMSCKESLVGKYLKRVKPKMTWDLGANTGNFSRIAAEQGSLTISYDIDPAAVEKHYLHNRRNKIANILPLRLDLTNPAGGLGWANQERMSLAERGPADAILALALVHHLAISNNVPLGMIAAYLQSICKWLVIEFVPKDDSQVQKLLATRVDHFKNYNQTSFESAFEGYFDIVENDAVEESRRTLYLMKSLRGTESV